jgi:hypothetical protein
MGQKYSKQRESEVSRAIYKYTTVARTRAYLQTLEALHARQGVDLFATSGTGSLAVLQEQQLQTIVTAHVSALAAVRHLRHCTAHHAGRALGHRARCGIIAPPVTRDTCQIVSRAVQFEHGHDELHEFSESVPHQLTIHVLEADLARDARSAVQEADAQQSMHEREVLTCGGCVNNEGVYIYICICMIYRERGTHPSTRSAGS